MSSQAQIWSRVLGLAALSGGFAIGWLDAHIDEVSVTLVALLSFSFLIGSLDKFGTRRAWLWALVIGIWVPVLAFVLPLLGLGRSVPDPGTPHTLPSYLALTAFVMLICLTGAYAASGSDAPSVTPCNRVAIRG